MGLKLVRDVDQLGLVEPVAVVATLEVRVALPVISHTSAIDTHALLVIACPTKVSSSVRITLASTAKHEATPVVLLLMWRMGRQRL